MKDPNADVADAKKTDAPQPDNEEVEGEEEEERGTDSPVPTKQTTSPRTTKKSDLDEPIIADENSSSAVEEEDSAGTDNDNVEVGISNCFFFLFFSQISSRNDFGDNFNCFFLIYLFIYLGH